MFAFNRKVALFITIHSHIKNIMIIHKLRELKVLTEEDLADTNNCVYKKICIFADVIHDKFS